MQNPVALKKFETSTTALKPLQNKLKSLNIDELLNHQDLLEMFRLHCIKERSLENIMFLESIHEFRELGHKKRIESALNIFETFFTQGSRYELNISNDLSAAIEKKIKDLQISSSLFDGVYNLVAFTLKDVWSRFIETTEYKSYRPTAMISIPISALRSPDEDLLSAGRSTPGNSSDHDSLSPALDCDLELNQITMDKKRRIVGVNRKSLRRRSSSSEESESGCTPSRKSVGEIPKQLRKSIERSIIRQFDIHGKEKKLDREIDRDGTRTPTKKKDKCYVQ